MHTAISQQEEQKNSTDTSFQSGYIGDPVFDIVFLIGSPFLALLLGWIVSTPWIAEQEVEFRGEHFSLVSTFIGSFIMAHLVIVFFRSHLNPRILKLHPIRFWGVPVVLFFGCVFSPWLAVFVSVLATWWDVYHSSLQTFGLGRIYDMKQGNHALQGRRLDYILNLILYMGPILAGATLMDHVEDFDEFQEVGSVFFTAIPAYVDSHSSWLTFTDGS